MPLWIHNSVEDYLSAVEGYVITKPARFWYLTDTKHELAVARTGQDSLVTKAEEYIDKFARINYEGEVYKWTQDVQGAMPSIPQYLSGSPTPMRNRRKHISDTSPIRVFIGASLNVGCNESNFFERGLIIAAFVMTLQKIRPVELYMWEDSRGPQAEKSDKPTETDGAFITLVRLGTYPINLSQMAYIFSSSDFSRNVMYQVVNAHDPASEGNRYPYWYLTDLDHSIWSGDDPYIKWLRGYLDAEPHDIFIPSIHTAQIITDPMDWMTRMLKRTNPELIEES